jgi:hypothetical protein
LQIYDGRVVNHEVIDKIFSCMLSFFIQGSILLERTKNQNCKNQITHKIFLEKARDALSKDSQNLDIILSKKGKSIMRLEREGRINYFENAARIVRTLRSKKETCHAKC